MISGNPTHWVNELNETQRETDPFTLKSAPQLIPSLIYVPPKVSQPSRANHVASSNHPHKPQNVGTPCWKRIARLDNLDNAKFTEALLGLGKHDLLQIDDHSMLPNKQQLVSRSDDVLNLVEAIKQPRQSQ